MSTQHVIVNEPYRCSQEMPSSKIQTKILLSTVRSFEKSESYWIRKFKIAGTHQVCSKVSQWSLIFMAKSPSSFKIPRDTRMSTMTRNVKNETRGKWQNRYDKVQIRKLDSYLMFLWVCWTTSNGFKDEWVRFSTSLDLILTSMITYAKLNWISVMVYDPRSIQFGGHSLDLWDFKSFFLSVCPSSEWRRKFFIKKINSEYIDQLIKVYCDCDSVSVLRERQAEWAREERDRTT